MTLHFYLVIVWFCYPEQLCLVFLTKVLLKPWNKWVYSIWPCASERAFCGEKAWKTGWQCKDPSSNKSVLHSVTRHRHWKSHAQLSTNSASHPVLHSVCWPSEHWHKTEFLSIVGRSFYFTRCKPSLAMDYSFSLSNPLSMVSPHCDHSSLAQLSCLSVTNWQL